MNSRDIPLAKVRDSLKRHRFFKLICGGSFTETAKIGHLTRTYSLAGVDCIDIAPDMAVLQTVVSTLKTLPPQAARPLVMVSVPLDPDPHFRKIELDEAACIRCEACLPVCPTEAITLPEMLVISQTLCYGCGRCVPTCPTDALHLLPFHISEQLEEVLSHPEVGAVEIHSRHTDPQMLAAFFRQWRHLLEGKLIALCFNPQTLPQERWLDFVRTAQSFQSNGLILQVDGSPMSGNEDPMASIPALKAARAVHALMTKAGLDIPITISGGINLHTATRLAEPAHHFIAGVGMGTVARQWIWQHLGDESQALERAQALVTVFKAPSVPIEAVPSLKPVKATI